MARNEHKKVLQQLSEAYQNVQEGLFNYRVQEDDGSWPIDEREANRRKNPDYGEPEEDGGYMGEDEDEDAEERVRLTLDSPGHASVQLPKGDPNIQKYLDKGYKIVKDYKKATQSEDENTEVTSASFGDNKGYDGPWKNPHRERLDSGAGAEEWDRQERAKKAEQSEDGEGWGNILRGAAISSILGKGAVTGGLAGAAYDALKDKPKKKKEDKEDKGFTKGGW